MPDTRLKTAVVGLDEGGRAMLAGLSRLADFFEVVAVADSDAVAAQTVGKRYSAEAFDDLRRLFVQKELDLVVSSGPLHNSLEHLCGAMKKGTHLLRYPPPARSCAEAAGLFKLAEEGEVIFATAKWWRQSQATAGIKEFIQANPEEQFYLVEAWCSALQPSNLAWLKDPQFTGGGVVLNLAYPLIDIVTQLFGVPQQVFSLCTNQAPDRKQRRLLTEETAVVSMRFDDRLIGRLTASRTMWPDGWLLRVHGKGCLLTLSDKGFAVRDLAGKIVRRPGRRESAESLVDSTLTSFAKAVLAGDYAPFENEAAETLGNMTLIQAAYLSDKTGMPEEPARIAEMKA